LDVVKRIKELADAKGWSIYKLAIEAGLTTSTLYSIMTGTNQPTVYTVELLCEALNISLSDFFKSEGKTDAGEYIVAIKITKLHERDKEAIYALIDYFLSTPYVK